MTRDVTIVALSKYLDLFQGLEKNLDEFAPGIDRIVVIDGRLIPDDTKTWRVAYGPKKFSMAGNANIGWSVTGKTQTSCILETTLDSHSPARYKDCSSWRTRTQRSGSYPQRSSAGQTTRSRPTLRPTPIWCTRTNTSLWYARTSNVKSSTW